MKKLVGDSNKLELFNIYGISEVSSWASIEKVDLSEKEDLSATDWITTGYPNRQICDLETAANWRVSIGAPLSGTEMEIRGEDGSVLQEGYGEIWIGTCLSFLVFYQYHMLPFCIRSQIFVIVLVFAFLFSEVNIMKVHCSFFFGGRVFWF